MPIEFRCDQCNKLLRTGDDTAGKQAKCPECDTVMTIPAATAAPDGGHFGTASPLTPIGPDQPQAAITPTTLDIGDVFSRTWTIFKPNWTSCLIVFIVVWLMNFAMNMASGVIPIVGPLAAFLFQTWIGIGQALFFLKKARGQDVAVGEIFAGGPYFLKILPALLLVALIVIGIVAVCVLPPMLVGMMISRDAMQILVLMGCVAAVAAVVYVMLMLSQFYYLILDRNVDVIDSLKTSKELMEGNKLTLLGIGLLFFVIMLVALIPFGLGLLVVVPYFMLMYPVIYLVITGQPTAAERLAGTD